MLVTNDTNIHELIGGICASDNTDFYTTYIATKSQKHKTAYVIW